MLEFKRMRKSYLLLLRFIFLAALLAAPPVQAQTGYTATLSELQLDAFPQVSAYLDFHDGEGKFIQDLNANQVNILENERRLPVMQLNTLHPGAQFVIVITFGPAMGVRDGLGMSRYDYLLQELTSWEKNQQAESQDDLSLLIDGGEEIIHQNDPNRLVKALLNHQPDLRQATPGLLILNRALEVAADTPQRAGMERQVLFITTPLGVESTVGLQNLMARARQEGIKVSAWLVASPEMATLNQSILLQDLVLQGGGSFNLFTGKEDLPEIESYLEPMRYIYGITYTSAITSTGSYTVCAEIAFNNAVLSTPELRFELNLQPPNPMFLTLPVEIERSFHTTVERAGEAEFVPRLEPALQELEVLIEFPDGHNREILSSTLYVDGQVAWENTAPPFDIFFWNLERYTQSGNHTLRVEVRDRLGLKGSSIEMPIQVNVQTALPGARNLTHRQVALLGGIATLLAALILGLVLVLSGRLRPRSIGVLHPTRRSQQTAERRAWKKPAWFARKSAAPLQSQPASESAEIQDEAIAPRGPVWRQRLQRFQRQPTPQVFAYLIPFSEVGETKAEPPIPISAREIVLGSDPLQTTWTIDDPFLQPVHAHLRREGKSYRIWDANTLAGTWVNYIPVSSEGMLLENGDLIHLGQIGFRLNIREPEKIRKPVIKRLETRS